MPYLSLTDRAMPYHTDGSVVKIINSNSGVLYSFSVADMLELNNENLVQSAATYPTGSYLTIFFPESRMVTGIFELANGGTIAPVSVEGSANSTNGLDGTWENANAPNGLPTASTDYDKWRASIKGISFSQAVRVLRIKMSPFDGIRWTICHIYGHKATGQTPDDILFLDAEAADAEFTSPLDFGDRPAGTSVQRQIKIQNASTTKTANNVNLYVEDPADIVRIAWSNTGPWQTTLNIASLAAGAKSNVIYVKCETPAPPTPLGPRRAPIRVSVGSWT